MKVLLVATVQSHICQFHKPLVSMLHEHGCEVHVAARDNLAEKNGLKLDFVEKVYNVPFQRSPFSAKNIKAYRMLKKIVDEGHYDVVHCNTPVGGVLGRLASRNARKKGTQVFYTAHGFHFYKGAPKKNWIIWYPVEKFMSRFTDKLITITKEDYLLAKRTFPVCVAHMHGVGVYTERYHSVSLGEERAMRMREGLSENDFVILCTGELNSNKNQKTLIEATALLKNDIPGIRVLLAGNGPKEEELKNQIDKAGLQENVKLMGYRTDLECITPAVDLVVSCSFREGLPLNIVEAMLCRKPVVASVNRGHNELIKNGNNGFRVKADDVQGYVEYIHKIYSQPKLKKQLGENGYNEAQAYTSIAVEKELEKIYFG